MGLFDRFRNTKDTSVKPDNNKMYNGYFSQQLMIPPNLSTADFLKSYGEIGWLFACVSKIAQNVADSEWSAYKNDTEMPNSKALAVLQNPNPFQSQFELLEITSMHLDLTGKAYWYISKDKAGRGREIWPLCPTDVWVCPDKDNFIKGYIYKAGATQIPLDVADIIWFKLPDPFNPYDGVGTAQGVRNSLEIDKYSAQHNRNFFYNGAILSGLLNIENNVSDEEYERIQEQFGDKYKGVDNAHRIAFIEGGKASFTSFTMNNKDMDFYNLRQMTRDEILGGFGVHKSILGLTDDVSRANAETAEYVFQKHCIKPRLKRIQDKLNNEFVKIFGEDIKLKATDPVPENKEFIVTTVNDSINKCLTVNEGRQILNKLLDDVELNPIDGGDTIYQQGSLIPLGTSPVQQDNNIDESVKTLKKNFLREIKKKIVRQINKNNASRHDDFIKLASPLEKAFFNMIQSYFKDMQKDVVKKIEEGSKDPVNLKKWDDILQKKSADLYVKIFNTGGQAVVNEFKSIGNYIHKDLGVKFDIKDPKVQAKIQNKISKITKVNEDTKQRIKDVIQQMYDESEQFVTGGNAEGFTIRDIMNRIADAEFPEFNEARCKTVAQTETLTSLNQATIEGYKQNSDLIDGKAWLPTYNNTRESHMQAGEDYSTDNAISVDEMFNVGGNDCECPGDDSLPAEEVVNCGCCMSPVVKV